MPNGHDKNWMRICIAINGFCSRYSQWPTRVRLPEAAIIEIRDLILQPEAFAKVTKKIIFVSDESAEFIAEDDTGRSFNYGLEGPGSADPDINALE